MEWFTAITKAIEGIFKPAADLVDNVHTSEEERLEKKAEIESLKNEAYSKAIDLKIQFAQAEAKLAQAQANIIMTEAKGESWLQRNWRPMLMVDFGLIITAQVVAKFFGIDLDVPAQIWNIMGIGIGGYVVTRGADHMIKSYVGGQQPGNEQ